MKQADRSPNRWFAAWRARPVQAPALDPADCGTAFGLDLSIPSADTPPPATAPATTGWRERWARRRRSA